MLTATYTWARAHAHISYALFRGGLVAEFTKATHKFVRERPEISGNLVIIGRPFQIVR